MVIAAESMIGAALINEFRSRNVSVAGTSRKLSDSLIYLDLADAIDLTVLPKADTVFLCAGINGFSACNEDPATAAKVNVASTLAIGAHYLKQGGHVIFLSSTAVFGNRNDCPHEQDVLSPSSTYGALKVATEIALAELAKMHNGNYSIVRLTKVFAPDSVLLRKWYENAVGGQPIEAFVDLFIAPISLTYVVNGLLKVADQRTGGCYHFSGESIISYLELANAIIDKWAMSKTLVKLVRQNTTENPQCFALATQNTEHILALYPQPFLEFLDDIYKLYRTDSKK